MRARGIPENAVQDDRGQWTMNNIREWHHQSLMTVARPLDPCLQLVPARPDLETARIDCVPDAAIRA